MSKNDLSLKEWVEKECINIDRDKFLKDHLIPDVDLSLENFNEFYEARKNLMIQKLKELIQFENYHIVFTLCGNFYSEPFQISCQSKQLLNLIKYSEDKRVTIEQDVEVDFDFNNILKKYRACKRFAGKDRLLA